VTRDGPQGVPEWIHGGQRPSFSGSRELNATRVMIDCDSFVLYYARQIRTHFGLNGFRGLIRDLRELLSSYLLNWHVLLGREGTALSRISWPSYSPLTVCREGGFCHRQVCVWPAAPGGATDRRSIPCLLCLLRSPDGSSLEALCVRYLTA
jgi:hypothetical protein